MSEPSSPQSRSLQQPGHEGVCQFCSPQGWHCDQQAGETGLCFWHDRAASKDGQHLSAALEHWVRDGRPMDGMQLARADLTDVDLVNHGAEQGYSCRNADLYRANLTGAHLFRLDARGSSLMKADLSGANLHCADLRDCNLLGSIFSHARMENVLWGKRLHQEVCAQQCLLAGDHERADSYWQEAEEVARNIRKQCEKQGMFEQAGVFFQKEMMFRRMKMPLMSGRRFISKVVDVFCGYGESPARVVVFSIAFIFVCALLYFAFGNTSGGEDLRFSIELGVAGNFINFLNALYFSVVTFTTLGYGDIAPIGFARLLAALEAFLGSFTMALFVVVFVKKMTR